MSPQPGTPAGPAPTTEEAAGDTAERVAEDDAREDAVPPPDAAVSDSRPLLEPEVIAASLGPVHAARRDIWRQAAERGVLAAVGSRLRQRGLTGRALAHGYGARLPTHAPLRARSTPARALGPAAILPELFVAGRALAEERVRRWLGQDVEVLAELGLVAGASGQVWATVTLLPVGEALVASDRADVRHGPHWALVADDSALHTQAALAALAARPDARWLDVGTGSAFVPLARPGAAAQIRGTDINSRALAMAELGAGLSGMRSPELGVADLLAGADQGAPWDLITFNAPLPARPAGSARAGAGTYVSGPADLVPRFWAQVQDLVAADGEVVVHSWQWGDYPACLELPGEVIAVRYTPAGHELALGVTRWRPSGPPAARLITVALDAQQPLVDRARFTAG